MKCYIDTNFLLSYILESSKSFLQTRDLMVQLRIDEFTLCISPLTIDEFCYNFDFLIRTDKKKRSDYYNILEIMLTSIFHLPNLTIVTPPTSQDKQFKAIELMKKYNLGPRDAFHLLTMLENDIEYIATYDQDFNKVVKSGIIRKYN